MSYDINDMIRQAIADGRLDDYRLNPDRVPCARCGMVARGSASINGQRYCHPDDPDAPDCYSLTSWSRPPLSGWTVKHEGQSG